MTDGRRRWPRRSHICGANTNRAPPQAAVICTTHRTVLVLSFPAPASTDGGRLSHEANLSARSFFIEVEREKGSIHDGPPC